MEEEFCRHIGCTVFTVQPLLLMKTNGFFKNACVRPVKADALITVNGFGFNTREPERRPVGYTRRGKKETLVRLTDGRWVNANGVANGEQLAELIAMAPESKEKWHRFDPAWGISKREWLRKRAAHFWLKRTETARGVFAGQMGSGEGSVAAIAALRQEQAVTMRWSAGELRRMAGMGA